MLSGLNRRINTLTQWMFEAKHLVVFTGAGISTESGLPDFRGPQDETGKDEAGDYDLHIRGD